MAAGVWDQFRSAGLLDGNPPLHIGGYKGRRRGSWKKYAAPTGVWDQFRSAGREVIDPIYITEILYIVR